MHDEDLLGYLLGALEPDEMRRVEQWLRHDPAARQELAEIERALGRLDEQAEPAEMPPPDLVSRTLASLPPLPAPEGTDGGTEHQPHDAVAGAPEDQAPEDQTSAGSVRTGDSLMPMHSGIEPRSEANSGWFDWMASLVAAAILLGLLLPALAEGRFESRKRACQNNLREFGTDLSLFSVYNQQSRLPAVGESGPEAFAGIFMLRLRDVGLLHDASIRWCPSLDRPTLTSPADDQAEELVALEELHRAPVDRLKALQRAAGGHYAYCLGVIEGQHYVPPRYEGRSSFAVMSDAPLGRVTPGEVASGRIGHSGRGINVLYEDGRVQFLPLHSLDAVPDHPLWNHRGEVEAGVNIDDASLGSSSRPPFINARQR